MLTKNFKLVWQMWILENTVELQSEQFQRTQMHFKVEGKTQIMKIMNERRKRIKATEMGQNLLVVSLLYINCHSSIMRGASWNSPTYFPVIISCRNFSICWKTQTCLEMCSTARISLLGQTTWPVVVCLTLLPIQTAFYPAPL